MKSFVVVGLFSILSASCASDPEVQLAEGQVTRTAAFARQKGQPAAEIFHGQENPARTEDLGAALRTYFVFLAAPHDDTYLHPTAREIQTWRRFDVIEELSAPVTPRPCTLSPPSGFRPRAGQLAIPFVMGTAKVHGVDVTSKSGHSSIRVRPDERYLVFASRCQDGAAQLPYWEFSVFAVDATGRIISPASDPKASPVAMQLLELQTIERLRSAVSQKPSN